MWQELFTICALPIMNEATSLKGLFKIAVSRNWEVSQYPSVAGVDNRRTDFLFPGSCKLRKSLRKDF